MSTKGKYVIRVYGILISKKHEVLLSDEYQMDMKMTKFPGGGMETGEGAIDCLKREANEEFGQKIEIIKHLYTTDFYQEALFYPGFQLISIYYQIELEERPKFKISNVPFDFPEMVNESQSFRWQPIDKLNEEYLTFPIDKKMVRIIKKI